MEKTYQVVAQFKDKSLEVLEKDIKTRDEAECVLAQFLSWPYSKEYTIQIVEVGYAN